MPDESPKYPKRTYLIPVVNFTRYFTRDLEVLVDLMTATRWYGVIIVKHYSPPKGSTFNADPLMVKFDRLKQEDGFLHVGVVKPTRTGRPFVGVPELEALACMHSRTAPIALRRQLMIRIATGTGHRHRDRRAHLHSYSRLNWQPNPPEIRFMDSERAKDNIAWQEDRASKMRELRRAGLALNSARHDVTWNREEMIEHQEKMQKAQANSEERLVTLVQARGAYARFTATEPLPGKGDG